MKIAYQYIFNFSYLKFNDRYMFINLSKRINKQLLKINIDFNLSKIRIQINNIKN